jgi:hypothetical protein
VVACWLYVYVFLITATVASTRYAARSWARGGWRADLWQVRQLKSWGRWWPNLWPVAQILLKQHDDKTDQNREALKNS